MSYENPEEARAKRAEKEVAREAKGKAKLGRKRKSAKLEAEPPEPPNAKVARILESKAPEPASASAAQISRTQVARVARMW
jgi:hypothetical protein